MLRFHPCVQSLAWRALLFSSLVIPMADAWAQGTSNLPNPTVPFSAPGTQQVTLQVCNAGGCTTKMLSVVVLDPLPKILSSSMPTLVGTGQTVMLQDSA